jgi:hypothetical protein
MRSEIAVSTLLLYGLRNSWIGGLAGGAIGGITYILIIMLFGFLDVVTSTGFQGVPIPESATSIDALYSYAGLCMLGIIGGAGMGIAGGVIVGPVATCLLYKTKPDRHWGETGAVIGGIAGTLMVFLLTGDNVSAMVQGNDTDFVGPFLVHFSGALGGVIGGATTGARFSRYLKKHPY